MEGYETGRGWREGRQGAIEEIDRREGGRRELWRVMRQEKRVGGAIPGYLFKTLILLVNNYIRLYMHMHRCPNNTLN